MTILSYQDELTAVLAAIERITRSGQEIDLYQQRVQQAQYAALVRRRDYLQAKVNRADAGRSGMRVRQAAPR